MSLSFGILVIAIGSTIKRYDNNTIDLFFWLGVSFSIIVILVIIIIVKNILKKTNEIGEL